MSVLDDDVSIVSGSTNITDNTQNLQITDLFENPRILQGREKDRSGNTDQDTYTKCTDGCEMSPLVPLQMSKFTQQSVAMEDSRSEMSELLIPVISMRSSATVDTTCLETQFQESQFPKESQSLLPQLPVSSYLSTVPGKDGEGYTDTKQNLPRNKNSAGPSQSSVTTTVMSNEQNNNHGEACKIFRKDTDDSNSQGMTVQEVKSLKNKSCIPEFSVFKSNDLLDKTQNLSIHTCRSKKLDHLRKPQNQAMPKTLSDLQKDQELICKMQKNINLSQSQWLSNGREGEITQMSQSQGTVTLTSQDKDPVDRLISRLHRLVSSLDKVPRRQMMVIEATVLKCITSLQDSLNNKIKKQSSTVCAKGTLRKLLQTTQNGLTKLTEQHKHEKSKLAQTGTQSTPQTRLSQQNQSCVNDLGNRQKKVLDLLKRQKYLVELYKTKNRPTSERNISVPAYSDPIIRRDAERRLTGNKIRSESCQESQRSRQERLRTASKKGVIETTSIKSDKRKISKEPQLKCTLDSTTLKEVVSNNFEDTGINHNVDAQFSDVCSRSEDQLNTELQTSDFENFVISQDLTTVPDTQDFSTQDTFRASLKDSSRARPHLAFEKTSGDLPAEYIEKNDEGGDILNESGSKNETEMCVSSGKDENATNNRNSWYDTNKIENVESNEKVKKLKLNENEFVNNAVELKDKTKVSEILWLNMLRDDTDKPVEREKETTPLTHPNQELFTARKMNEIKEMPVRKGAVNVSNYNTKFTFTKPLICNTNIKESDNVISAPKEIKTAEICLKRNTKLCDETRQNVLGKRIEENNDTNRKNGKVMDDISSPPNAIHPGETWHNVSPTATSMSSDVFMVKMKDLQKRLKRRNMELEQTEELSLNAAGKDQDSKDVHSHMQGISDQDDEKLGRDTENIEICNEDPEKLHDTISEAIDSVIEQSRVIAARQKTEDIKELENIQMSEGAYEMGSERYLENFQPECQVWKKPYITATDPRYSSLNNTSVVKEKKQLTTSLPTLRDLVHSGKLAPGKAVLSCLLRGAMHRASLTPLGKIRTQEGVVFTTASQWVSTLTDGTPVKKRKAYEMVLYQNRQLISFCEARPDCAKVPTMPSTVAKEVHLQPSLRKHSVDQGVQVDESAFISSSSTMSEDEKRLNVLLSNSVIRLLTEKDLVPCEDLPDNFWTEDFSKVKLHKDIWDAVDAW